ncbi:hypothetical protein SAMN05428957_104139 [Oryzisolibacter propanilivorax]|uniref:Uncharacterized protein n=2 Tax=Oryzisolibacter propanilivorax TaxID=1527607 RepID=A0A1G9S707_9BURK|nr:hypothetical protein SAMN05428957_104139 [Oryzisolibacter propanilivorax]
MVIASCAVYERMIKSQILAIKERKVLSKNLTFAISIMAASFPVLAQQANKAKHMKKTDSPIVATQSQTAEAPFAPIYFDSNTPVSAYLNNRPGKIYRWLEGQISSVPNKPDQFSTAEEKRIYEADIAERMAGVGHIPMIFNCQKKYNSDAQSYEINFRSSSIRNTYDVKTIDAKALNVKNIILGSENMTRDSYMAQNAYGAETRVHKMTADVYSISFPFKDSPTSIIDDGGVPVREKNLPYLIDKKLYRFNIPMQSSDARAKDKHITCMVVFSIAPPYILKYTEHKFPTRDDASEDIFKYHSFYGAIEKIAVFDALDEKIIAEADR